LGDAPLGKLLAMAHRSVAMVFDANLRRRGASLPQWVLLREAELADGVPQRELAARMGIEPPTLVGHLDRLVEEGLVERRADPSDRRVSRVVVTAAGRQRLRELTGTAMAVDGELRGVLSEAEAASLRSMLTRIQERFAVLAEEERGERR
jgi:MarR family transcriptional regulator for hemolysin